MKNENQNIMDFIFVIGWQDIDGQKKVKLLMRLEIRVLKLEIQSREVDRDSRVSYEVREESFYKVSGVFKNGLWWKQEQVPRKIIRFSNQGNIDNLIKQFRRE